MSGAPFNPSASIRKFLLGSRRGEADGAVIAIAVIIAIGLTVLRMSLRMNRTNRVYSENIAEVRPNDPRMQTAMKDARDHWSEFAMAFMDKADDNEDFAIKKSFDMKGGTEHMWVQVTYLNGDAISGILVDEPEGDVEIKVGDKVECLVSDVEDWYYADKDGHEHGEYTQKVLDKIATKRRR